MIQRDQSRGLRWASELTGESEHVLAQHLHDVRVGIRLDPRSSSSADARESLLLATNMLLRFCPVVTVFLPSADVGLAAAVVGLGEMILGDPASVRLVEAEPKRGEYDAMMNVSPVCEGPPSWLSINSTGWVARLGLDGPTEGATGVSANHIGALAASALGVGAVSMKLLGYRDVTDPVELSLWNRSTRNAAASDFGPDLAERRLSLDGMLIGCGAVTNGWAYAARRIGITGSLAAVDHQRFRIENNGPYILGGIKRLHERKVDMIHDELAPGLTVTPFAELFEFFRVRIETGMLPPPESIIAGLDGIPSRHAVQRMWPHTLIDMGSGGTTAQVVTHRRGSGGICLLEALRDDDGLDPAEQAARVTGLPAERIRDHPTDPITDSDVVNAPPQFRAGLAEARDRGQLVCGRVTDHYLNDEEYSAGFAAAVPFVSALAGIIGAAETARMLLTDNLESMHLQFDFRSMKLRALQMTSAADCECSV